MEKCIELAKKAEGMTSPNPLVGCVVTDEFDNVIATGYHHKYGENHAERDALLKINKGDGDTLYCQLVYIEPKDKKAVLTVKIMCVIHQNVPQRV